MHLLEKLKVETLRRLKEGMLVKHDLENMGEE